MTVRPGAVSEHDNDGSDGGIGDNAAANGEDHDRRLYGVADKR